MMDLIQKGRIAIDIETSGLRPYQHRLHLIAVGNKDTQRVINFHEVKNIINFEISVLGELVQILEDRSIEKIGHNIAFDALWLAVKLNCRPVNLYDTMTMEKIAESGKWLGDSDDTAGHGMKQYNLINTLKRYKFKLDLPDKDITKTFIDYEGTEFTDEQINYAKDDIKFLFDLREKQWEKIVNFELEEVAKMEKRFTEVLVHIQKNGINFDLRKWIEIYNENKTVRAKAEKYLNTKKFINWASPPQVLEALKEFDINVPDTNSNTLRHYLRDRKLKKMQRTILERLLEFRLHHKRVTSFGSNIVASVDPDMRIRGNFNQLLATGRMSMMKPNLQQIPGPPEYRACFKASPGKVLVCADYSSQELVIIATGAGEKKWLDTVKEGKDLHSMSAALLYGDAWTMVAQPNCEFKTAGKKCSCPDHKVMRDRAKSLSFGLAYGLTYKTYAHTVGVTEDEAATLYDKYFDAFPAIENWLEHNADYTQRHSNAYTFGPFYRRRRVTDAHNYRKRNIGKNTPVQGTAGDMMKLAAIKFYNWLNKNSIEHTKLLLLIHDEIMVETDPEIAPMIAEQVKECMEAAAKVILEHNLLKADPIITDVWKKE